jgi:hypothetical protein
MNTYAHISESVFQAQVINLAQWYKWRVAHFRSAMTRRGKWVTPIQGDAKGFPDLILLRGYHSIAAELKSEKGRVTSAQQAWLDAFIAAGYRGCVWRPSMIDSIELILKGPETAQTSPRADPNLWVQGER